MAGAYLFGGVTILQLHAQGMGVRIPSQALAALPYVVTIVALVVIMARRGGRQAGPASLGTPFIADR
jgi:general nucleoside transport system permease protein